MTSPPSWAGLDGKRAAAGDGVGHATAQQVRGAPRERAAERQRGGDLANERHVDGAVAESRRLRRRGRLRRRVQRQLRVDGEAELRGGVASGVFDDVPGVVEDGRAPARDAQADVGVAGASDVGDGGAGADDLRQRQRRGDGDAVGDAPLPARANRQCARLVVDGGDAVVVERQARGERVDNNGDLAEPGGRHERVERRRRGGTRRRRRGERDAEREAGDGTGHRGSLPALVGPGPVAACPGRAGG